MGMVIQKLYAYNPNLGIYITDDNYEEIADGIEHYETHLNQDGYDPPEIEYVKECIPPEIPDDETETQNYIENLVLNNAGNFNVPPPMPVTEYVGEYNSGEIVVNKLGYIPLIRRIQDLERAGEVLRAYRESIYDGHDIGDDDMPINPVTAPNADFVDVDIAVKKAKKTMDLVNKAMSTKTENVSESTKTENVSESTKTENVSESKPDIQ